VLNQPAYAKINYTAAVLVCNCPLRARQLSSILYTRTSPFSRSLLTESHTEHRQITILPSVSSHLPCSQTHNQLTIKSSPFSHFQQQSSTPQLIICRSTCPPLRERWTHTHNKLRKNSSTELSIHITALSLQLRGPTTAQSQDYLSTKIVQPVTAGLQSTATYMHSYSSHTLLVYTGLRAPSNTSAQCASASHQSAES